VTAASDDRELRDDKGQLCVKRGTNFKYQYLYDDHLPCRVDRSTTAGGCSACGATLSEDHAARGVTMCVVCVVRTLREAR